MSLRSACSYVSRRAPGHLSMYRRTACGVQNHRPDGADVDERSKGPSWDRTEHL